MSAAKLLILTGLCLVLLGLAMHFGPRIPFLGQLPGDIRIKKDNFSFYFPLGTCLLISLILSLILALFRK